MDLISILSETTPRLLDGAMGTQLSLRGLEGGGQNCLAQPDAVEEVHRAYAAGGAELLITNTLTMNRIYVETHKAELDVREVNLAGCRIARAAAGPDRLVLGNLSSTGQMLEPYGSYSESQFVECFTEQATALAEGGVDGFIIETMFDMREAVCAIRGCREVSESPVIASIAFTTDERGGRTVMGNSAAECAEQLSEAGASAVGANCGDIDPDQMSRVISIMRGATDLPIVAEPNAGKPKLVNGETIFDMDATAFARGVARCVESGALLVGGCCGTSPAHIAALGDLLSQSLP